jgi:hypothetical protein
MLTACLLMCVMSADPAAQIEVRVLGAEGTKVEFVGKFAGGELDKLPKGDLDRDVAERWLRVTLVDETTGEEGPAILGTYQKLEEGSLHLVPRFSLSPGGLYRATITASGSKTQTSDYRVPASPKVAAAQITEIYPSANRLPANLLKFYIHFSRPMREGQAVFENVELLDENNQSIVDPWRLTELWNQDATRLTMFIHPGRIKEGVNLREEEGPVLVPNRRYTLKIHEKMLDAKGQPLGRTFTKQFTTTSEDHERIDVARWSLHPPQGTARAPLRLELPKALDRHLMARCLRVEDSRGNRVEGAVEVLSAERVWQFTPAMPWKAEKYTLEIDGLLEDLAGNTPLRQFDYELKGSEVQSQESPVLRLPFQPDRSALP